MILFAYGVILPSLNVSVIFHEIVHYGLKQFCRFKLCANLQTDGRCRSSQSLWKGLLVYINATTYYRTAYELAH